MRGAPMPPASCNGAAIPRPSDWSSHYGRAGLVFVDGSHAYDYARKDSETAMRLVRPKGVVLWHDYGVWPGVTQALEELETGAPPGAGPYQGHKSGVLARRLSLAAAAGQDDEDPLNVARPETPASAGLADIASRGR